MNKNITYKEWLGPRFANRFDVLKNFKPDSYKKQNLGLSFEVFIYN